MTDYTPATLMAAHVRMMMGTYFDADRSIGLGIRFASSSRIADHYWNYAYNLNCAMEALPGALRIIREHAAKIGRAPCLCITPDTQPGRIEGMLDVQTVSSEVWMAAECSAIPPAEVPQELSIISVVEHKALDAFLTVFRNAYSGSDEAGIGYSGLPEEYPLAVANSSPMQETIVEHYVGFVDGRPVTIASAYRTGAYIGLYNVGTTHGARGRGYATAVSAHAIQASSTPEVNSAFLQTEAGSPVEQMYAKIGFSSRFEATVVAI